MTELVTFLDSFDHTPVAWAAAKYTTVQGSSTVVAGPHHGDGRRFSGGGNGLWPALVNQEYFVGTNHLWDSGGWGANVRVSASGLGGAGAYLVLLQTCWADQVGEGLLDFHHHELRLHGDGHLACYVKAISGGPAAMDAIPGATSAAGAFPFDRWVALEYTTRIRKSETGDVACRVDGALVLEATGVETASKERALITARYFRFGNLLANGNTADVDVDDVCARGETTLGADPLPWWGAHRVACVLPVGPGPRAEHALTAAGPAWQAAADLPPAPGAGDTSYVTKSPGSRPVDEYAAGALPVFVPAEGAACWVWGLGRVGTGGGNGALTLRVTDGTGATALRRSFADPTPHYKAHHVGTGVLTALTQAQVDGLLVGYGNDVTEASTGPDTNGDAYEATQLAAELWYRPGEVEPPAPGAQRWSVGWVG